MKRYGLLLSAVLTLFSILSCTDKEEDVSSRQFTGTFAGDFKFLDGSGTCLKRSWDGVGSVAVYNFDDGSKLGASLAAQGESATITLDEDASGTICAVLPGDGQYTVYKGQLAFTIPSDQSSSDASEAFAFAVADGARMSFRNVTSLARVEIADSGLYRSISLSGESGEKICGMYSLDPSDSGLSLKGGTGQTVSYGAAEGVLDKGTYCLQFAPTAFSDGFTMTLTGVDGTVYSKTLGLYPNAGQAADFGSSSDWAGSGTDRLNSRNHPRLLMSEAAFADVKSKTKTDQNLAKIHSYIMSNANSSVGSDALTFKYDAAGKRILAVSREAIRQIMSCAYAYRYTGLDKYLKQAESQMKAVCAFTSWNAKTHFLDVGEMCVAVGIGYDWLYDALSDETKELAVNAIRSFAFTPVFTKQWSTNFFNTQGNWEQVCCGGLTVAALSIYEECPEDAQNILDQCIASNLKIAPKLFSPDGNYPEGYGYWGYGCDYQALMNYALETALGVDNYSKITGISKTPRYFMYMEGPAGYNYCYYDTSPNTLSTGLAMWYFAYKENDPSILANEILKLNAGGYYNVSGEGARLIPMILPWMASLDLSDVKGPSDKLYVGNGSTPVIAGRSSWTSLKNTTDVYFGFKGGKASQSHGHMDAGSFVFDSQGVRWAWDFTRPSYATIENALKAAGGNFWSMTQTSLRWTVNVMNNKFHNTLTVNGADHIVSGLATIKGSVNNAGEYGGTIDITPALSGQISSAVRTVKLVNDRDLVIVDELKALSTKAASVEWRMASPAAATIEGSHIKLTKDGKTEYLTVSSSAPFTLTLFDTSNDNGYDSNISAYSVLGFKAELSAGTEAVFTTKLSPTADEN